MDRDPQQEPFSGTLRTVQRFTDSPNFWEQQIHTSPVSLVRGTTSEQPTSTHCNNQVSSCHDCKSSVLQDLQQQTGEQPKSHLLNSLPRLATPSLRDLKEPVGHGLISHPGASLCHKASDNPFQHSHWYLEPIHHWGQMFLRTKPLGYLRVWTGIKCTLIRRPSSAKQ